ncbi:MAG: hypothetical protein Homavirus7_4 [Homavirus sp.]|uniref:Uncharacterized protein n=1 Tax=Homavirus sp. TaxID=2487769 RepID=A0A3G5A4F8_9VIRU|nr:MAG: hypothetical protein Homavirus7_4 [Homavirus sp.]
MNILNDINKQINLITVELNELQQKQITLGETSKINKQINIELNKQINIELNKQINDLLSKRGQLMEQKRKLCQREKNIDVMEI